MRTYLLFVSLLFLCSCEQKTKEAKTTNKTTKPTWALAIHGGAGTILKANMQPGQEDAIRAVLDSALTVGEGILADGGAALDAVEATVMVLENSPHFNAGHGAVFTHEGKNELDVSIMNGEDQTAGAASGITTIKNPIRLARAVMEKSPHVILSGTGAEQFAKEQGLETVNPSYFRTERRWKSLQKRLEKETKTGAIDTSNPDYKFGTVGCVALDLSGNLAAGTSTGGMTNKRWGRIGDSPIVGAGTYANNSTCAVSCTGHGEYFLRYAVAHDVHARMAYGDAPLAEAADAIVHKLLVEKGGSGGLIAIDKNGNVAQPFNSEGMYRGWVTPNDRKVALFKND